MNVGGCYWDGGSHSRDNCTDLIRALERGDVHRKGVVLLYLGREDSGTNVRVPVPVEVDGKISWQKEWVEREYQEERKPG